MDFIDYDKRVFKFFYVLYEIITPRAQFNLDYLLF